MTQLNPTSASIKKHLIILLLVTAIVYLPTLFNGFVGDDEVLFLKNDFFHSIQNIKVLFSKEYISDISQYYGNNTGQYQGTGEPSYRPVKTASYLIDAWIWGLKPFGYHLTNYLFHLGSTALLFLCLTLVLPSLTTAFLAALLFGLHPIQTEVVAGLSYRNDSMAAFFCLASWFCYLKHHGQKQPGRSWMLVSLACYFLGIFTKESVIVYPALIFMYEALTREAPLTQRLSQAIKRSAGYFVIAGFYLFIYFFVFPKSNLGKVPFSLVEATERLQIMAVILFSYLKWFIFPHTVNLLPGLYVPSADQLFAPSHALVIAVYGLLGYGLYKVRLSAGLKLFFLLWFLMAYLPVSNIIPLASPCAHRFMYFPSIGLFVLLAVCVDHLINGQRINQLLSNARGIILFTLIGLLIILTMPMTFYWRSNFSIATQWVKHYPHFYKGHEILALQYYKWLQCDKVIGHVQEVFRQSDIEDPRMHFLAGRCLEGNLDVKLGHLKKAIELQPQYQAAYFELGKQYYQHALYDEALTYLNHSNQLAFHFNTSIYLMKTHLAMKQPETAERIFQTTSTLTTDQKEKDYLAAFYRKNF